MMAMETKFNHVIALSFTCLEGSALLTGMQD